MKIVRFLPLLLLFALTITACSNDDDEPQVIPFPSEGIVLTMEFEDMNVNTLYSDIFYSHAFYCDYEFDFYYDTKLSNSFPLFRGEVLNKEYEEYIGRIIMTPKKRKDMVSYAYKKIEMSISLKIEYKDHYDELYEQLKTNPFRVRVYDWE